MKLAQAVWLAIALCACSEARRNLVSDPKDTGFADAAARDAGLIVDKLDTLDSEEFAGTTAVAMDAVNAYCGKRPCSCDDSADNDLDGLADGLDPECTGAFDDDEESFATGKPTKQQACRDCYWDANNGSGDDGCRYPVECLTNASFTGQGNCNSCTVTAGCESSCKLRTPNGCDCFGCCTVARANGELLQIQLVDTCTLANADDTVACPRCTQHETCKNECGRCELCLGKTLADLPADCASSRGPGYACEDDLAVCSSTSPCPDGFYCHQGCCLVDLL